VAEESPRSRRPGVRHGLAGIRVRGVRRSPAAMAAFADVKQRSLGGNVLPFNLAVVHLGLGDHKQALEYLERAYASDSQWMGWLNKDRTFDPLRSEPRFIALLEKLGLVQ
jgi:hypothetical protein